MREFVEENRKGRVSVEERLFGIKKLGRKKSKNEWGPDLIWSQTSKDRIIERRDSKGRRNLSLMKSESDRSLDRRSFMSPKNSTSPSNKRKMSKSDSSNSLVSGASIHPS